MTASATSKKMLASRQRGHLRFVGISSKTFRSYSAALRSFFGHLRASGIDLPGTVDELDHLLSEYINICWHEGESHGSVGCLLSGFHRFMPQLKRSLPTAWQYFNNWQRTLRPVRATPLSLPMVKAMAACAFRVHRYDLGVLFLLGFACLLRTAELLGLLVSHISSDPRLGRGVVALADTKTARAKRAWESVVFEGVPMTKLVLTALQGRRAEDAVYPHSTDRFRAEFDAVLSALGLEQYGFLPYSLRRGGATWFFAETGSLDSTIVKGRWKEAKTARIYIDDGTAVLAALTVTPEAQNRVLEASGWLDEWASSLS